ncbi:hypothetical protein ACFQAV_09075 [Companilactobacillus huachuanensis]|uniref:Type II secretion system protein n=1 Tax=Companilactobacillus huachuanensis TaxID=2559914 RepID=A0ABW1RLM2_9LACO|nr:hypothetical protein [Companilactobacillus huachuanensis]
MKKKHDGFVLIESLTAFAISLMIILTLSYCVNEQFKLINYWEERVNADKIILLHIKNKDNKFARNFPNKLIIKGQSYYFTQNQNFYQVEVNKNVYKIFK